MVAEASVGAHTPTYDMIRRSVRLIGVLFLCLACERRTNPTQSHSAPSAVAVPVATSSAQAPKFVEPTRLARLPISAYRATLALDDEAAYLLTSNAAYRLAPGQPPHGIELELGIGSVLTRSFFVFWSKDVIWAAPKQGGMLRQLAKFPHQPQYFVASGDSFAWIDLGDDGQYTIQTLEGKKPRILVASTRELSALNMIGDAIYFVQRPTDATWRIGVVRTSGAAPEFGSERSGRRPAMMSGIDRSYFYEVDKSEIRVLLSPDPAREEVLLSNFVCSPIHVSDRIYCGCVEGLFEVPLESKKPHILSYGRPGPITNVASNSKMVVWTVDVGADELAVDMLRARGTTEGTH
jgi:hypothetical protein